MSKYNAHKSHQGRGVTPRQIQLSDHNMHEREADGAAKRVNRLQCLQW